MIHRQIRRRSPRLACLCLLAVPFFAVLDARADTRTTPPPQTLDQVQFQQKTVEAQMQELQDRMFRLADLTRQSEPDDSARLVMALQKAREELIIEQMREVLQHLSATDLSSASVEQQQVLIKLEELKKLLTSTDLDMQMQLERLRKLTAALAKLDKAITEEKRQRDQSGNLARQAAPDPQAMTAPQQEQKQNRQTTDTLAQTLKDLGPDPAKISDGLGNACQSMSLAEGSLGAAKPSDARGLQSQAVDQMQQARDQLEQARQKILDELQTQVRAQVIEALTEMLDRQKNVRGATEAIVAHAPSGDPQTAQRVEQLSPPEAAIIRICDETSELINQTEFSVALPPALDDVRAQMAAVQNQLETGVANQPLVSDEKQVESELADLLDTFKQLAAQPGPPSACRGCKGNKNKLLAELKVIRMMQVRADARTVQIDQERLAAQGSMSGGTISTELAAKIAALHDTQAGIQKATDAIHQELTAPGN